MVQLYCQNPIKSCGRVEHRQGSYYWLCNFCDCPNERLRVDVERFE